MSKGGIKKQELLTYAFLAIITFCKGIDLTSDSIFYVLLFIIGTALVFFKVIREKFKLSEILVIIALFAVCLVVFLINHNNTPLFLLISIISMRGVNTKQALTVVFFVHLVSFLGMILLSSTGIVHDEIINHTREAVGLTARHSFGYKHPNLVQMHLLSLTILFFYLYNIKNTAAHLIWLVLNGILYNYTYSRTSFSLAVLYLIFHYFFYGKNIVKKMIAVIGKYSFAALLLITIILYLNYDNLPIVKEIDIFLTGRIYYLNYVYKNFPITLFGLSNFGQHVAIDNSYFGLLYKDGLIILLIALFSNFYVCKKWLEEKKYNELVLVLFLNLVSFTENFYLIPVINVSLLLYSDAFFPEKTEKRKA